MSGVSLTTSINSGIYGMQMASQSMQQSAQQIASAGIRQGDGGGDINAAITGGSNTSEPLVQLKNSVLMFNASAKVVDTSDELLGRLLDVRA